MNAEGLKAICELVGTKPKVTYVLGDQYAPYLINGDSSNLTVLEKRDLDAFLEGEGLSAGKCIDCEEYGFTWHPDFGLAGECQTFTFTV